MRFTYYGHSCFTLQLGKFRLLFDPFIRGNELAKNVDVTAIGADYILVSHGHSDHVADLVEIAKRTGARVLCSWEIFEWLSRQGVSNVHPMNIGGWLNLEFGWVKMVFAAHSNSLPDGTYGGTAAGWLLNDGSKTVYYSGDTALTQEMKLIGEYWKPDVTILPVGDNFTMGYKDAAIASDFIKCNHVIGVHFDTFGFIKLNHEAAQEHFKKHNKKLTLMQIGETMNL